MGRPSRTCKASQTMTSPPRALASRRESSVLPAAVGPTTATIWGLDPPKLLLDLGLGHAEEHRATMGAVGVEGHLVHRLQEGLRLHRGEHVAGPHHRVTGDGGQ